MRLALNGTVFRFMGMAWASWNDSVTQSKVLESTELAATA